MALLDELKKIQQSKESAQSVPAQNAGSDLLSGLKSIQAQRQAYKDQYLLPTYQKRAEQFYKSTNDYFTAAQNAGKKLTGGFSDKAVYSAMPLYDDTNYQSALKYAELTGNADLKEWLDAVPQNVENIENFRKNGVEAWKAFDTEQDFAVYKNNTDRQEKFTKMTAGELKAEWASERNKGWGSDWDVVYSLMQTDVPFDDKQNYDGEIAHRKEVQAKRKYIEGKYGITADDYYTYDEKLKDLLGKLDTYKDINTAYVDENGNSVTYANLYYSKDNEEKLASLAKDTTALKIYEDAKTMQDDLKLIDEILQSEIPSAENTEVRQDYVDQGSDYKTNAKLYDKNVSYIAEKYGVDLGSAEALYDREQIAEDLKNTIKQNVKQASDDLKKEGYDYQRLYNYEKTMADKADAEKREKSYQLVAENYPLLAAVASSLTALPSAVEYWTNNSGSGSTPTPENIDTYAPKNTYGNSASQFSQVSQSVIANKISEDIKDLTGSDTLAWLASTGYSGITSALSSRLMMEVCIALASGGEPTAVGSAATALGEWMSLFIMGSNAANQALSSALERGANNGSAVLYSLAAGINEALFEKVSLDAYLSNKTAWDSTRIFRSIVDGLKSAAAQGGVEASEEVFTTIANTIADGIINGSQSEYQADVQKYLQQGFSAEEAKQKASEAWIIGVLGDAFGGFVGGAAGGGLKIAGNTFSSMLDQDAATARQINRQDGTGNPVLSVFNIQQQMEQSNLPQEVKDQVLNEWNNLLVRAQNNVSTVDQSLATIKSILNDNNADKSAQRALTIMQNLSEQFKSEVPSADYTLNANPVKAASPSVNASASGWQYNGSPVAIERVESVSPRAVKVRLNNGEVVNASALQTSDQNLADLFALIPKNFDAQQATGLVREYTPSVSEQVAPEQYARAYNAIYNAGVEGIQEKNLGAMAAMLPQSTVNRAYNAGVTAGINASNITPQNAQRARMARQQTQATENTTAQQNATQRASQASLKEQQKYAQEIARKAGFRVVFEDLPALENGFLDGSGVIHINNAAQNPVRVVLVHELTHYAENSNRYSAFARAITDSGVFAEWLADKGYTSAEDFVQDLMDRRALNGEKYTLDRTQARQEMIAQFCESTLFAEDTAGLERFLSQMTEPKRNAFVEHIQRFFAWLKNKLSKQSLDEVEMLEKRFTDALKSVARGESAGDGVRYHISEKASEQIQDALDHIGRREEVRLRDYTPQTLVDHGVRDLPMVMKASHVRENILTEDQARAKGLKTDDHIHYHGLGKTLFMQVIDSMDEHIAVYRGTSNAENPSRRENYFVVLTSVKDSAGHKIVVPVYINETAMENQVSIDVNKIATVFGPDADVEYINQQVRKGNLVKIKRRSVVDPGRQPSPARNTVSSADIIFNPSENVNPQFSESENDTNRYSLNDAELSKLAEETDGRTVLSRALETVAQTDADQKIIADYQKQIDTLNELQDELDTVRYEIKTRSFERGARDMDAIRELQARRDEIEQKINRADRSLLKLESTQTLKNLRAREQAASERLSKAQARERVQEYRDRAETQRIKEKIKKIEKDLTQRLTRGSEQTAIPKELVNGVIDVINEIDPTGKRQDTKVAAKRRSTLQSLGELRALYNDLQNSDNPSLAAVYDSTFSVQINALHQSLQGQPLRDLTLDQLRDVYTVLREIVTTIQDANQLINWKGASEVYDAGKQLIANQKEVKDLGLNGNVITQGFLNWTLNPYRGMREMSGFDQNSTLWKLQEQINNGIRTKNWWMMNATKPFERLRTGRQNVKNWEDAIKTKYDFGFRSTDGASVKLTKMQAMQILLTYEREQANPNRRHLANFVLIPDADLQTKGKYKQALDKSTAVVIDPNVVERIENKLNDWDLKYLREARHFFQKVSADAINEVSLQTKRRLIATEKAYVPYEVSKDYTFHENSNVKYDASLLNKGMLQSVIPNASNPLVIRGLDSLVDRHIADVAQLYGLAVPIQNWNKIFNMREAMDDGGNSVRSAIRSTWGDSGLEYLEQIAADLQSSRQTAKGEQLINNVRSAFVQATLAANLSVAVKQAASYFAAGSVLSNKSLVKGFAKYVSKIKDGVRANDVYDNIDQITAANWIRRQGLSSQELGDASNLTGWSALLNKKLGKLSPLQWIQSVDVATTTALFYAVEEEIKSQGLKKGTAEYNKAVADLYDTVLEETQPMYDAFYRGEVTKNTFWRRFNMFLTQPLQNAGILRSSFADLQAMAKRHGKNSTEFKQARTRFGKAVASQAASQAVFAVMTLLGSLLLQKVDKYRDKDTGEISSEKMLGALATTFGENFVGSMIPVVGNAVFQVLENAFNGTSYDVITDPAIGRINSFANLVQRMGKDPWGTLPSALMETAGMFGIPAKNAYNIVNGIRLHLKDAVDGQLFSFEASLDRTVSQTAEEMYQSMVSGDSKQFYKMKEQMGDSKKAQVSLKNAIKAHYLVGELNDADANKYLTKYAGTEAQDAYWIINKWQYELDNGDLDGYSMYNDFYDAVDQGGGLLMREIRNYTNNGVETQTLASQITQHYKTQYLSASPNARAKLKEKLLDAYVALGYDRTKKSQDIDRWLTEK